MRRGSLDVGRVALVATLLTLATGCSSFRKLDRDLEELEGRCEARITLTNLAERDSPHIVFLFGAETKQLANVTVHHGSGEISMLVPTGDYYLAAYEDRNENLKWDKGERARFYGSPTIIRFGEEGRSYSFTLELDEEDLELSEVGLALVGEIESVNAEISINNLGEVVSLDDERFASEFGEQGMWEPASFISEGRNGLYMLEEYDPARTPIVFVHGVGGTPRDFAGMIASIDKSRYQAWIFYYPSALRLAYLGQYLGKSIDLMVAQHEVENFMLVAHSMGGLVSTEYLQLATKSGAADRLRLFVTIASPLGGIPSAQMGVDWSPTVMPCWYDLAPGSAFLKQLYRADTSAVPYYLAFAYERSGFSGPSSDGTVPMHSQLRLEAQGRALNVFGVDSDHVGVLSDPATLGWINGLFLKYGRAAEAQNASPTPK